MNEYQFKSLSRIQKWFIFLNFFVLLYFFINVFFPNYKNNSLKPLTRLNYEWIINTNFILQYSGYLILKSNKTLSMEAFIFNTSVLNDKLSCIIWYPNMNLYHRADVTRKININLPLIKVFCELNEIFHQENVSSLYGAIVLKNKIVKNTDILFQKLSILDSRKEKIKGVGHCVHTLRGLNSIESKKFKMVEIWIKLQREIGIDEIKFYIFNSNHTVVEFLKKKFKSYISFVDHRINHSKFCDLLKFDSNYQIDCDRAYREMKKRFGHQVKYFHTFFHSSNS